MSFLDKLKALYLRHKESWLFTLCADLFSFALIGLASGAVSLAQDGNLTTASLHALVASILTATVRQGLRELQNKFSANTTPVALPPRGKQQ